MQSGALTAKGKTSIPKDVKKEKKPITDANTPETSTPADGTDTSSTLTPDRLVSG
jgi:hypothetical protein